MHCTLSVYVCLSRARAKALFPFKRNRLRCMRCVRCVNENRKKRKRLRWQAANQVATASTEHSYWLALVA